jgi:UDP-MurNAc hydroxylase
MRLTYIANACSIVEQDGFRLVTDPWLTDGVFEGSWCHWPPLVSRPADLRDVDLVYISHLHPDHYDEAALSHVPRTVPVVILRSPLPTLKANIDKLGFSNIIELGDGERRDVGPLKLTMYSPFVDNLYHDTQIGNLLDSALVVEADNQILLNTNDNGLTAQVAAQLVSWHGPFTLAQLGYNSAGPYPSCFQNLDDQRKLHERDRIVARNLAHMVDMARVLKARFVMPFAGDYVLGGSQTAKNPYLATTTPAAAVQYVRDIAPDLNALDFREGTTFDLADGQFVSCSADPECPPLTDGVLDHVTYPYETDPSITEEQLVSMLFASRARLWKEQRRLSVYPDLTMYIQLPRSRQWRFSFRSADADIVSSTAPMATPYLACTMDNRLLVRILDRRSHWNNAEIGCHIDFFRDPDIYFPDAHTLMSFFHLPR